MRDGESKLTFQGSPKVDPCPNDVKETSRFHQLPLGLPDRGGGHSITQKMIQVMSAKRPNVWQVLQMGHGTHNAI